MLPSQTHFTATWQPFVTPKNPKFEINKRNQSKVFLMNNYTLEFNLSKINNNVKKIK